MDEITIKPLAFVKNDRKEAKDDNWGEVISEIVLVDNMPSEALEGIEEFSHLEILFHFHKADRAKIVTGTAHPRNNPDWPEVGIFCQRRKNRPNLLGLTVVELVEKKDRSLIVKGLDAIDGTPVIDIKPLTKGFLPKGEIRQPWWIDELMKKYWHKG
jgi:tRNA-Thr(GGU) m(6)t(6)A37 methyltransferase TsaA